MNIIDELAKSGEYLGFYGTNENCFKIGRHVFEAIEDPNDGYRSCLQELKEIDRHERDSRHLHFFKNAVASVKVVEVENGEYTTDWNYVSYNFYGHKLVDSSGHVWLTFGTDSYDDYYPCFVFQYTPKKEQA